MPGGYPTVDAKLVSLDEGGTKTIIITVNAPDTDINLRLISIYSRDQQYPQPNPSAIDHNVKWIYKGALKLDTRTFKISGVKCPDVISIRIEDSLVTREPLGVSNVRGVGISRIVNCKGQATTDPLKIIPIIDNVGLREKDNRRDGGAPRVDQAMIAHSYIDAQGRPVLPVSDPFLIALEHHPTMDLGFTWDAQVDIPYIDIISPSQAAALYDNSRVGGGGHG